MTFKTIIREDFQWIMQSSSGIRAIRQVRRKKSNLLEVKIVVVGAPGVGKSGRNLIDMFIMFEMFMFQLWW